jgi:hypothetical protein
MALVCQFVDSISATPTLRLDLNLAPWQTLSTTDLGFPELHRAIASTLLTDGEQVPASAYGNRVLSLRLQVNTALVDDTATEIQKLARELNRPFNLLKTQLGTAPVFFRTFRSSPDSWQIHTDGSFLNIDAEVLAEPFGYGLLETPVSAATLATNPASANGHLLDVTGVKGDVETPALIRWPASAVVANRESLFAVRRRGTPSATPFLWQAEALTQGTDTTTLANDAAFSGAGNNYSRTTFATVATMATRLTLSDLGTASVDLRGRYRVYARYRKNTAGDAVSLQIQWGTSGGTVTTNTTFVTPNVATLVMADLGEVQIPRGQDPVTNLFDGVAVAASDTFHLAFRAQRVSGSGTLDIDYLILVPADDGLSIIKWVEAGPDHWWLDGGDNARTHARNSSGQIASAMTPGATTPVPMLSPNQTNRLFMVYEVGSGLTTTLTTITVTVSYFPRYLSVRPAST